MFHGLAWPPAVISAKRLAISRPGPVDQHTGSDGLQKASNAAVRAVSDGNGYRTSDGAGPAAGACPKVGAGAELC